MRTLVTPLATLLKTADEMIVGGHSKKASASLDPFVEKLAAALEGATESVQINSVELMSTAELDKIAQAINVLDTAEEIETYKGLQTFEEKARGEGFSENDISEAMQKIAAVKLKNRMPLMVALSLNGQDLPKAKDLTSRLQALSRQGAQSNAKTQGY